MKNLLAILGLLLATNIWADNVETILSKSITIQPPPQPIIIKVPDEFTGDTIGAWRTGARSLILTPVPEVTLQVTGLGGVFFYVVDIMKEFEEVKAAGTIVNMEIIGRAVSGHAFLTCIADKVILDEYSSLYFHAPYAPKTFLEFQYKDTSNEFIYDKLDADYVYDRCLKSGSLTKKEVEALKDGKEVIVYRETGNIKREIVNSDSQELFNFNMMLILASFLFLLITLIGAGLLTVVAKRVK